MSQIWFKTQNCTESAKNEIATSSVFKVTIGLIGPGVQVYVLEGASIGVLTGV